MCWIVLCWPELYIFCLAAVCFETEAFGKQGFELYPGSFSAYEPILLLLFQLKRYNNSHLKNRLRRRLQHSCIFFICWLLPKKWSRTKTESFCWRILASKALFWLPRASLFFQKGMRSQYKTFHLLRERFYYQASSCFGCKIALFFQKSLGMPSNRIIKVAPIGPGCRCFSDTWRRRTQPCIYIYMYIYYVLAFDWLEQTD